MIRIISALLLLLPCAATAQQALPFKFDARATEAAITPADLMTRVYLFADDSMMGRDAGTPGNLKATAYIAGELKRLGLTPAGENGTYFQSVPLVRRSLSAQTQLSLDGKALTAWDDYAVYAQSGGERSFDGVQAVYAGTLGDQAVQLTPESVTGKLVIFRLPAGGLVLPQVAPTHPLFRAAAIAIMGVDAQYPAVVEYFRGAFVTLRSSEPSPASAPLTLFLPERTATLLLGTSIATASPLSTGRTLRGRVVLLEEDAPARNVVAVLPGTDPSLRSEYVAIGAHSDHIGVSTRPLDHDSVRAFNAIVEQLTAGNGGTAPDANQLAGIRVNMDSIRRAAPAARLDSINNGADDDASGSMGILEIAESFARGADKPRRSLLFVWHTGEEKGLYGARQFSDHPTVPREAIVAQLNVDMIGRGGSADLPGGGPGYLQLIGSRRLSTELGDLVESVNKQRAAPFTFDYAFDANGHPENYYCRSDHYEYARWGIPITFFTTGNHRDYHQVTDEPQYLDYAHLANVTQLIRDVAQEVANLDHRVVVNHPRPDPKGQCQQ
jgi:hypothetical protein